MEKRLTWCIYGNAALLAVVAFYYFLCPAIIIIRDLNDPGLKSGDTPPRFAYSWHRSLSKKYETWASKRVASGQAAGMSIQDISGTEWPIFGTVFYLWATESLQEAWEKDPSLSPVAPNVYAREAIEASAALVSDPNHAGWVRKHWGDEYLARENLFYRMLLISGLTSYQKLTGEDKYEPLVRKQTESLANELDQSPYGLLDDYPGQCYPVDILPAIAAIHRADEVLGTDHAEFVQRAVRAFQGNAVDELTGLPTYIADSRTGQGYGPARGVGIAFMLIWAPHLWEKNAQDWYASYDHHFWQREWATAGFREFAKELPNGEWFIDVDAGPVIGGYGTAASAFGIGTARTYGRFDQAYPLSAEALTASWPLPDGTRLGPRMFSNLSDAPYVGETAMLFSLTRQPIVGVGTSPDGYIPASVYFGILFYLACGGLLLWRAIFLLKLWRKSTNTPVLQPALQFFLWIVLFAAGVILLIFFNKTIGVVLVVLAQTLPVRGRVWSWLVDYDALEHADRNSL
ncbi:MAG TPA: hypothetical protein VFR47_10295 [Anaerolineales bacterium]|nr:hypothetical protein [Anaerolineales bacterium]